MRESMEHAARFGSRLPLRESLLVRGELARTRGLPTAIDIFEEAAARYPHDAEVWYYVGEAHAHLGAYAMRADSEVERSFARAVELNPMFSVYYPHLVWYTIPLRDSALSAQRLEGFARALRASALDNSEGQQQLAGGRLFAGLKYGTAATRSALEAALDTMSTEVLHQAIEPSMVLAGHEDLALSEKLIRAYLRRPPLPGREVVTLQVLVERGKLAEVATMIEDSDLFGSVAYHLHRMGTRVTPKVERLLTNTRDFGPRLLFTAAYGIETNRPELTRQALATANQRIRSAGANDSIAMLQAQLVVRALDAYQLGRKGEPARAAAVLDSVRVQFPVYGSFARGRTPEVFRWWAGEFLLEANRAQDALPYYNSLQLTYKKYLLAQVYEKLGDTAQARANYTMFLEAWNEADPGLPAVAASKAALARLTTR